VKTKRLMLMQSHTINDLHTSRSYREFYLRWVRRWPSGTWVAFEGLKKIATVERVNPGEFHEQWRLDYAYSTGPGHRASGGCHRPTAEECKKHFEAIYTGKG